MRRIKFTELKKRRLFWRFLITYVIILVIPLIFGAVVYNNAHQTIKKYAIDSNLSLLNQTREILERHMEEVNHIARTFSTNRKIQLFRSVKTPFVGSNTFRVVELSHELADHDMVNKFIDSYYICFKNSDIIVSPNIVYKLPKFYNDYLNYNNLTYHEWYQQFFETYHKEHYLPARDIIKDGDEISVVTYLQSFGYPGHLQGAIMVLINNQEIKKMLMGLDMASGGWAYIADEEVNVITSISEGKGDIKALSSDIFSNNTGSFQQTINNRKYLVTYTRSTDNGWYYVAGHPLKVVMEKVDRIKKMTLTFLITALLTGLLIATILSSRNSKPIQEILCLVREKTGTAGKIDNKNSYHFLKNTVSSLLDNNKELEESINEQKSFLKTAFKDRLFQGEFHDSENIKSMLNYSGIKLEGNYFTVIILEVKDYEEMLDERVLKELKLKRIIIKDVINKTVTGIWENCVTYDIDEKKMALLLEFNSDKKITCKSIIEEIVGKMKGKLCTEYGIKMTIAIGGIYNDIIDVAQSFDEARRALDYRLETDENEIRWFADIKTDSKHYYYPLEVETRLINVVKTGNQEQMENIFANLYQENFKDRKLSGSVLKMFITEVNSTIIKILEQISWEQDEELHEIEVMIEELEDHDNLEEKYNYLNSIFHKLCSILSGCQKPKHKQLKVKIKNYLDKNYMDPSLGLSMVAREFNFSEVYISQFFRDYMGDNFHAYLENLRMQKACQLLTQTEMTVKKIAKETGYNSSRTFSRAFKRNMGVTPSHYRNSSN